MNPTPSKAVLPNYREVSESPAVHVLADVPDRLPAPARLAPIASAATAAAVAAVAADVANEISTSVVREAVHTACLDDPMLEEAAGDVPSSSQMEEADVQTEVQLTADAVHAVKAPRHDAAVHF